MRQYSLSSLSLSDSTTYPLVLVKQWEAKWFIFPQTERWATFLGSPMFSAKEFPPQYFFMSGIFRVLVIIFAPFVSRIAMLLLTDTLTRFVCPFSKSTASPSSKVLVRVRLVRPLHKRWNIFVNKILESKAVLLEAAGPGFHKWSGLSPANL